MTESDLINFSIIREISEDKTDSVDLEVAKQLKQDQSSLGKYLKHKIAVDLEDKIPDSAEWISDILVNKHGDD